MNLNLILILSIMFSMNIIGKKTFIIIIIITNGLNIVSNSLDRLSKKLDNNEMPKTPFWTAVKRSYDEHRR